MVHEIDVNVLLMLISVICAAITIGHTLTKDSKAAQAGELTRMNAVTESLIKVNVKLDQVCSTTTEIRSDIRAMDTKQSDQERRITILERDMADIKEQYEEIFKQSK